MLRNTKLYIKWRKVYRNLYLSIGVRFEVFLSKKALAALEDLATTPATVVAQVALEVPPAGIHILRGPTTVKSGYRPAETTSMSSSATFAIKLAVCAAHLARTRTRKDPTTAGSGRSRALMKDTKFSQIIVARLVDDAVDYYKGC